jgi:single-strand DNA-binding protein
MATLNQIMLIGRLGKDPTSLQVTKEGKPFIRFSLAVDQSPGQDAMWLNVTAWEKQAEAVEKYARKGTLVFVQGRLQMKKYKDKSQVERLSIEINATNVQLLEKWQKEDPLCQESKRGKEEAR